MTLERELERAAAAGGAHGEVAAVLAAEPSPGDRSYLLALGAGGERRWLVLDAAGGPVAARARVRAVASLVAACEVAADLAGRDDAPRLASPGYLDAVGSAAIGSGAGAIEAFVAEVEERYAGPLR